jgi:hypothetical protein
MRERHSRISSGTVFAHGTMCLMTTAEEEIRAAARKREKSKAAFERDDAALRELFVKWRAGGYGPSDMARWSGLTREWVAKIAPDPSAPPKKRVVRVRRSKPAGSED